MSAQFLKYFATGLFKELCFPITFKGLCIQSAEYLTEKGGKIKKGEGQVI